MPFLFLEVVVRYVFDDEIAKEIGVIPALMYSYFVTGLEWIRNEKNSENMLNGRPADRRRISRLSYMFPYLSVEQIDTGLKELEDSGFLAFKFFEQQGEFLVGLPGKKNE